MKFILPFLFVLCITACMRPSAENSGLGELNHEFVISEAAKDHFDQGLLLLHSFEYDDAREAFERAREADPDEVMAYWGLAMTHYKALWGLQDMDAGRKVMLMLGDTEEDRLAKAGDPLEEAFWKGIEILYGEGEFLDRNQHYADHMALIYEKNPKNLEVAAFYSLGLMWADYENESYLNKSSGIAEGIIRENPTHPGALHYMIHANDNPENAYAAINAANEYAEVAPDATHALHMPSHIYVALGMWNEVVRSNEASYAASLKRVEQKQLDGTHRGYHSMAWLHYGYLQQGQFDKAAKLLAEMISYRSDSTYSPAYLISMQNQHRIETGAWPANLEVQQVNHASLGLAEMSQMHFLNALVAYDRGDVEGLQTEIDKLREHLATEELQVSDGGIALCSSGPTRYAPTKETVTKTRIVIHQMEALRSLLTGANDTAEEYFLLATKLEREAHYDPGPPFVAYPSFEQYGDWLLEQERYEEALRQFDQSLTNRTNRAKALKGKIAALKGLGNDAEARKVEELLLKVTTTSVSG